MNIKELRDMARVLKMDVDQSRLKKECTKCKEKKHVDEFYHLQTSQDGYMRHCKKCHSYYSNKNTPIVRSWVSKKRVAADELAGLHYYT